jgi:TetR/AcrR family transcriptional regulator, regulator of cefoperazone and chloramphenicol sensitivity
VKKKSTPGPATKKKPRNSPRQKRTYESPARQRQADETRSRIAAAARLLLTRNGYAGMTIPAVAAAAGVAVPTVYAIFGSKKGIVSELLDQARFGDDYHALVNEVQQVTAPLERLTFVSRIARRIYESEVPIEDLLRGAGMLAPELASVEEERDCQRYDRQLFVIDSLHKARLFRPGLTRDTARDILWCLTSRDLYRMLIRDRNWTPQQYETWLNEALRRELVKTT